MSRAGTEPFPHGTVVLLGLITIAAYGAWYYAFGVLLDPILVDTGWSEAGVTATFSLAAAVGAISAVGAGRLMDRVGSRPGFLAGAVLSTIGLVTASYAQSLSVFAFGAVLGGASLQGLGFYHITQTAAARAAPDEGPRAIARLTVYGAFASTIYLPLTAFLVTTFGWRVTMRVLVLGTAAVLVVGAALVREKVRSRTPRPGIEFRRSLLEPSARRFIIGSGLIGAAVGVVLVYQVPLMTGAGLSVTTAAWMAGARGAAQITGRIPLPVILARLGPRASVRLAFATIGVAIMLLTVAGSVPLALLYVAVAGFGIGATSPLQGIYAGELFGGANLGASLGVVTMVFGLSSAAGPAIVGVLAELTGSRWWGVLIAVVAAAGAVFQMRPIDKPTPG